MLTLIVIAFFVLQIYESNFENAAQSGDLLFFNYSPSPVLVIAGMLVVSLLAWLSTIRTLHNSQKTLLQINDEYRKTEAALKESEASFRELFDNANDLVYTTDLKGNLTSLNKMGEIITGYSQEEACEMNIVQVIAPEFITLTRQKLAEKLKNNTRTRYLIEIVTKDEQRVVLEISNRLIYSDGKPIGVQGIGRDITDWKNTEEALRESQQRLELVMNTIPHAIFWKDKNSVYKGCNQYLAQIAGLNSPAEVIGLTDLDMPWAGEEAEQFIKYDRQIMESEKGEFHLMESLVQADGTHILVDTNRVPLRNPAGEIVGILGTFEDVTERKQAEAALYDSEYKLRALLESMSEGLIKTNNEEVIEFVNDRICEMTGFSKEELIGRVIYDVLIDGESAQIVKRVNRQRLKGQSSQYEIRLNTKSGSEIWVIVGGAPIINVANEITGTMGIFTDITERKLAEEKLLHDALHDSLTGLANRSLFVDHLQLMIERGRRDNADLFAVLFMDFDRFKIINDSLGHAQGDMLLKLVAKRLENLVRSGDLVARLGGDEFTILLAPLDCPENATRVAERILEDLQNPFNLNGNEIFISASIGVAMSTVGYNHAEDMLRDADIAMYRAKAKGKAQYQVFDKVMLKHSMNQLQLETEMRQGFERGDFLLYYQPIFNLQANTLAGFEALLRWQHYERGLIPPGEFIPAAEENGLILSLGRWILYESCRQLREWQTAHPSAETLTVSVNLSCKQFQQPDLVQQVVSALIATRLEPHCLKLEITESHLMENSDMSVTTMNRLRELGVELSLDDFGTGYSSLSYLHRLPVNYLKIDQSFVGRMVQSRENGEIVNTIIKLAQNLRMKVIAEGVETTDQARQLKHLNCEYGQGYFFSKPLASAAAKKLIEENPALQQCLVDGSIVNLELNM